MTDPVAVAEAVVDICKTTKNAKNAKQCKPILTCWMGEQQVLAGRKMTAAGVPHFRTPEAAVEAFAYLTQYRSNQKLLMQVPPSVREQKTEPDVWMALV